MTTRSRITPAGSLLAMLIVALLGGMQATAAGAESKRPPNVVIIFIDDMGYADIGPFGAKVATPNLDKLAAAGTVFTDFYVPQAVCSASRAALLTGCHPNRVGIFGALGPGSKHGISSDETTIAEIAKSRGYATACFGKWHLGDDPVFLPPRHGFDEHFGIPYSNDMWPQHPTAKFPPLPLIEGEKIVDHNVTADDQAQFTTQFTERAVSFIDRNKDKPFLLYVPHPMVHVPLYVSDKFAGKSGQGLYGDVVMELDWSVGQIVAALERHGLTEDTLVIFTSDNGPWLSYGDHGGSTGPLREGKGTEWDGGVRVPTIMSWPGTVPAGRRCAEPLMTIDLLPTIAHLTGADLPKRKIDGKNIWPIIAGEKGAKNPHHALFFYWSGELQAVRSGPWKLHFPHSYRTMKGREPGTGGMPGKYTQAKTGLALYNLESDIGQTTNVAEQYPEVVARLTKYADEMRADLGDSLKKMPGPGKREPGRR